MKIFRLGLCALALLLPAVACAADMEVVQPWARVTPGSRTGAVYFTLHNGGAQSDRLMSGATPLAERAELHSSIDENGVMRMEKINAVEINAGGSVPFQPSGMHVMLINLSPDAAPGKTMPVTLHFEHAGDIQVSVPILAPGTPPPAPPAEADPQGGTMGRTDRGSH